MNGDSLMVRVVLWVRILYHRVRKMLFTKKRPHGPFLVVDANKDDITQVLGTQCFGPNWAMSYNFKGEVVNVARRNYQFDPDTSIMWWQVHVRGWVGDDGLMYLRAHYEPEPTVYTEEHLDGAGYNLEHGMTVLRNTLEQGGIDIYREVDKREEL